MRDSKAEFQFIDFATYTPTPDVPETSYNGLLSNLRATTAAEKAVLLAAAAVWLAWLWVLGYGLWWVTHA
jgi:hypothetical protein